MFGNHDEDQGLKTEQEMMVYIRTLPYAVSQAGPSDVFGVGNYYIQLVAG